MGGWYSSGQSAEDQKTLAAANYPVKSETWFDARRSDQNNNENHVVIIPMDMSKHAEGAFEWYVRHLHKSSNIVRIIHCQEIKINPSAQDLKTRTVEESLKAAQQSGRNLIDKYEAKLQQYQIQGSVHSEYGPTPGEMIISSADRFQGNHIVMGSRGLGIIRRSILGSVSHYVLDHTAIPVTIIPKGTKIEEKLP